MGFRIRNARRHLVCSMIVLLALLSPRPSPAITLDEAIARARENLPSYKAALVKVRSTEALYEASRSPYLPSLDGATTQERRSGLQEDFNFSSYDLTLSYILFDGGRRKADRNIARLNLDIDREALRNNLLDLYFNVRSAFYNAVARKEILSQRAIQLEDAQRDYEVAEGRRKFGVAKLSDVLQASVRLEQAKFNLVQAQGELKKALADFNSLIGRSLRSDYDLEGTLAFDAQIPDLKRLSRAVLDRPEIKQAKNLVQISKNNKAIETSAFFPVLSANASYTRIESNSLASISSEDKSVGITATWNLFEWGKIYRRKSSVLEIGVSENSLDETKRQLLLDLHKTYDDFITASQNVRVAEQQLKQAGQNYSQAFGEFKVGKGDILSLVQAESALAIAREQLTASRLELVLSRVFLERQAGVENLEALQP